MSVSTHVIKEEWETLKGYMSWLESKLRYHSNCQRKIQFIVAMCRLSLITHFISYLNSGPSLHLHIPFWEFDNSLLWLSNKIRVFWTLTRQSGGCQDGLNIFDCLTSIIIIIENYGNRVLDSTNKFIFKITT